LKGDAMAECCHMSARQVERGTTDATAPFHTGPRRLEEEIVRWRLG
jgi:hypothetical protein